MKYNKQHQGDKNRCKSRCKGGKPYERENEGEKYLLHTYWDVLIKITCTIASYNHTKKAKMIR